VLGAFAIPELPIVITRFEPTWSFSPHRWGTEAAAVILNANGQDLGSTEVALTAGAGCAGGSAGEAVRHCYDITPTNASGRDAAITFF
jgi:hypothetical protein